MGGSFQTLTISLVSHPFCTLFIIAVVWIWVNIAFKESDEKNYNMSYSSVWKNRQYWRILSTIFTHNSVVHVVINVNCIWNLRYLEDYYGSFFMIKYTVVLAICEVLLAFAMISLTVRGSGNNPMLMNFLHNLESLGCSGVILAWLTFQSVASYYHDINPIFMLLGILSISASFAPLIMLLIFSFTSGRNNIYANSAGLINGYALGSGILLFLPNIYWSLAFLFDVFVVMVVSAFNYRQRSQSNMVESDLSNAQSIAFRVYEGTNQEELIEIQYDLLSPGDGDNVVATELGGVSSHGDANHFRSREEYDEEALEPLLVDGVPSSVPSTQNPESSTFQRISSSVRRSLSRGGRNDTQGQFLMRGSSSYSRVESEEL